MKLEHGLTLEQLHNLDHHLFKWIEFNIDSLSKIKSQKHMNETS